MGLKDCAVCLTDHPVHLARNVLTACGTMLDRMRTCAYTFKDTSKIINCARCLTSLREDICANNHGGASTSVEAFQSTSPESRETLKTKIFEFIAGFDGIATCELAEDTLGLSHQSASARISELLRDGRIYIEKKRGKTRTGRGCRVYRVGPPSKAKVK
jgi:DNA-binding transcriptional ArsR family regulator